MSEPNRDDILARVKKLLAFTAEGSGASTGEIENAVALARKLLDKYDLDLADLEGVRTNEGVMREDIELSRTKTWQGRLLNAIAKGNDCRVINKAGMGYAIFGRKSNVEIVLFTALNLMRVLPQLAKASAIENAHLARTRQGKTPKGKAMERWVEEYIDSFMNGACTSLWERFKQVKNERSPESKALVATHAPEVNARVKQDFPFLVNGEYRNGGAGYAQGKIAGANVSIQQGIRHSSSGGQTLQLGHDKR